MSDHRRKALLDLAKNWKDAAKECGPYSRFADGRADQMKKGAEELEALVDRLFPEEPEPEARGTKPGDLCWTENGVVHHKTPCEFPDGTLTDVRTGRVIKRAGGA